MCNLFFLCTLCCNKCVQHSEVRSNSVLKSTPQLLFCNNPPHFHHSQDLVQSRRLTFHERYLTQLWQNIQRRHTLSCTCSALLFIPIFDRPVLCACLLSNALWPAYIHLWAKWATDSNRLCELQYLLVVKRAVASTHPHALNACTKRKTCICIFNKQYVLVDWSTCLPTDFKQRCHA